MFTVCAVAYRGDAYLYVITAAKEDTDKCIIALFFLICVTVIAPLRQPKQSRAGHRLMLFERQTVMKKKESEYREQFIQYVVTQVPVTGLWVGEGQVLVREDGTLK